MTRRTLATVAGALTALLAVTACSAQEPPAVTVTATPESTATRGTPPEPAPEPSVWPLTGVPADEVAQRPALAVKIENSREARPQTGLEYADIVWEEVVEGGITRFVAIYHSQLPETVSPVRSARPMDPAIVAPLGGILAYSGAQPQFIDAINAAGIQSVIMDAGHPGFARDRSRRAPHNVVGTLQTFLDQAAADRAVPPPAQFVYAEDPGQGTATVSGTAAGQVAVTMSRGQRSVWDWNAERGVYELSNGATPSVSTSGARHSANNVLLIGAQMHNTPWLDPAGTPVPETVLVGSGEGLLASGGKSVPVTWSKESTAALLVITDADGAEVQLEPGTTWVHAVPVNSSGSWAIQ
ncbi:conserved hypothetical protein [Xylanimonas cellulosilytica DSM 15894]|uniref:DUF3048 domain-containing protein n=1 Tax=Xylanimonas cellulosilytica (strain DSM 15894 / JCM 12276 / CECT 5975 / KCTC 9989 / LMG 20990 / NBRC 107835 / XIL07) TaxID=446471 RepID=D1BVY8_XYLCX|nr:DUF3048 domain-containing protein [Xylanimonas cellulosilytica]ACZ29491.1 conserved hypothetical protein [Xylanimonas cellulosilytica DSM 15894]